MKENCPRADLRKPSILYLIYTAIHFLLVRIFEPEPDLFFPTLLTNIYLFGPNWEVQASQF